jgi:hypothetical protein
MLSTRRRECCRRRWRSHGPRAAGRVREIALTEPSLLVVEPHRPGGADDHIQVLGGNVVAAQRQAARQPTSRQCVRTFSRWRRAGHGLQPVAFVGRGSLKDRRNIDAHGIAHLLHRAKNQTIAPPRRFGCDDAERTPELAIRREHPRRGVKMEDVPGLVGYGDVDRSSRLRRSGRTRSTYPPGTAQRGRACVGRCRVWLCVRGRVFDMYTSQPTTARSGQ